MKYTALAAAFLALLPAVASAGSKNSREYDRGKDYSDKSRFDVAIGLGSGGYSDYSYANFRYSSGYGKGYAPRYPAPRYSPPVVYRLAPCPPPVVYFPPPPVVYYPSPIYYRPVYGAYGYSGGCYR